MSAPLAGLDEGGASSLVLYRAVGSAGAAAAATINDTAAAAALTITAFYKGIRANNFQVVIQANAGTPANKDVLLYESGRLIASCRIR